MKSKGLVVNDNPYYDFFKSLKKVVLFVLTLVFNVSLSLNCIQELENTNKCYFRSKKGKFY